MGTALSTNNGDGSDDGASVRKNLLFPNEILEKILSFLSIRDKLLAREVCISWLNHINNAAALQETVKVNIQSDEVLNLLASTDPVFTSIHFRKIDLTRQSMNFWRLYSEHITHLDFYDCSVIPRRTWDCDRPDFSLGCPNLKHLGLVNCDKYFLMGGKFIQLHEILCLDNLECLDMSRNKNLTDNILFSILDKTTKLRCLNLSDCINMVFMQAVHNRFYSNFIEYTEYSDNVLSFHTVCDKFLLTKKAQNMREFNFGMKLNSTGLNRLLGNGTIRWEVANLESPELKVPDLKQFLAKFHSTLLNVKLGRCKLSSGELFISNLHSIRDLSLHDSRSILDLLFLKTMPYIRNLTLDGISGVELSSDVFSNLRCLTKLSINGIKPLQRTDGKPNTTILLECLKYLGNLTSLDVGNCSFVNDELVQNIVAKLRYLKKLNLESTSISDVGLAGVSKQEYNERKVVSDIAFENASKTCSLAQLKDLEYLNLSYCSEIGEATWQTAIKFLNLNTLNLSNCNALSKQGLLAIISNCRNLEKLLLLHCSRQIITDSDVLSAFREKLYRCKEIIY